MASVSVTQKIDAPVETVFALASDLDGWAARIKDITKIERLTAGPVGVGTRFKETRVMFGKEATETMEFVAFDPPRRYALGANSCGCKYHTEFRFEPEGGGTLLTCEFTGTPMTLGAKLMVPLFFFMKGMMRKCLVKDINDLKAAAEGAPATV